MELRRLMIFGWFKQVYIWLGLRWPKTCWLFKRDFRRHEWSKNFESFWEMSKMQALDNSIQGLDNQRYDFKRDMGVDVLSQEVPRFIPYSYGTQKLGRGLIFLHHSGNCDTLWKSIVTTVCPYCLTANLVKQRKVKYAVRELFFPESYVWRTRSELHRDPDFCSSKLR